jgi:spoIIIJ-associated protein
VVKRSKATGRTVEQAIEAGLAELGVSRDQVEVELLPNGPDDPAGEVVVQLTVREDFDALQAPPPPLRADSSMTDFGAPPYSPPGEQAGALSSSPMTGRSAADAPASVEYDVERGSARARESAPASGAISGRAETSSVPAVAREVLERLLRGMGIRSQVVVRDEDTGGEGPDFVLDIIGADLGILIGRRGETLRDLEYLSRLIVAQQTGRNVRFVVDVEGYRARRERMLRELARRMADRVRQSRQPITLEAMPPHERRIVHITLREHPTVRTQSIGEGDRRRVMILPK